MTPEQQRRWLEQHPGAKFYAHPETLQAIATTLGEPVATDGSLVSRGLRIDCSDSAPVGAIVAVDFRETVGCWTVEPLKEGA